MTKDLAIAGRPANGVAPVLDDATSKEGVYGPARAHTASDKVWTPAHDCPRCNGLGTFQVRKRGLRLTHVCPCIVEVV